MDGGGEVAAEELDFHLGTADNDENISLNLSLSSKREHIAGDVQSNALVEHPHMTLFLFYQYQYQEARLCKWIL